MAVTTIFYHEAFGSEFALGRETPAGVVLEKRLRAALAKVNPGISPLALTVAVDHLTRDRSVLSPVRANQEIYRLLKDGIGVSYRPEGEHEEVFETVQVIDWNHPRANDFFLASQFRISGDYGRKRADLVGFVNGLPLVFIELKASHQRLELAFERNLSDYRTTIPQVFWHNAFILLSNGSQSRIGSLTAGWEHFAGWKKINDEGEEGVVSLETMIRGVCEPARLLDLVENFTVYSEARGEVSKLLAKNHQFLGVNNAIAAVEKIRDNQGRLGVFWHTQGSGKSYSMVFFSQKVLRRLPGNWTFVIVTDRDDLDGQIYRNFASTGALIEEESRVRAASISSVFSTRKTTATSSPSSRSSAPKAAGATPSSPPAPTSSSSPTRPTAASTTSSPSTCATPCPAPPSSASPARPSWPARSAPGRSSAITSASTTSSSPWTTATPSLCITRTASPSSS